MRCGRGQSGFSLIEIIVAVSLLTLIVLGLVYTFSQTQRAFTTSMSQVDVLETGRAVTDMLARELAEMTPSQAPDVTNFYTHVDADSFSKPLWQDLPLTAHMRTNVVQRFYFLSRLNQDWIGRGYFVLPPEENAGLGTLYRFEAISRNDRNLSSNFQHSLRMGWVTNPVANGIVHLRLVPFDVNGVPITWTNILLTTNTYRAQNPYIPNQTDSVFMSNVVPASVELELGILEKGAVDQFRALGETSTEVQRSFLSNRAAQVHIFRQRIPIRNVDPYAYISNTVAQ